MTVEEFVALRQECGRVVAGIVIEVYNKAGDAQGHIAFDKASEFFATTFCIAK